MYVGECPPKDRLRPFTDASGAQFYSSTINRGEMFAFDVLEIDKDGALEIIFTYAK